MVARPLWMGRNLRDGAGWAGFCYAREARAAAARRQNGDSERAGLASPALRIPRAGPAGALLLSARKQKNRPPEGGLFFGFLAERGGFEPPIGYEPIHAFQACDLNHSSISPDGFTNALVREAAYYSKDSRQYKCILSSPRSHRRSRARQPCVTTKVKFPSPPFTITMVLLPRQNFSQQRTP